MGFRLWIVSMQILMGLSILPLTVLGFDAEFTLVVLLLTLPLLKFLKNSADHPSDCLRAGVTSAESCC